MPSKSSAIWNYFDKLPNDSAKCRKCRQILNPGKGSTKGLWDHLKSCSPNAHAQSHPQEKQKNEARQQKSLQDLGFKKADASLRRQETKEELIAGILLRQNIALSFVEDPGVKQIFADAYPDLKLTKRRHFREVIIPRMAARSKKEIINGIGTGFFAATSDGWQKPSRTPALLSITVHYIDDGWQRRDKVLAAIEIPEMHSGDAIANLIAGEMESNKLPLNKMICLVRDDASNMRRASSVLNVESFQCVAHFIHLVVVGALKKQSQSADVDSCDLKQMIDRCSEWVTFSRTKNGANSLAKAQEKLHLPVKKLIKPVSTRWNSTLEMLNSVREQKKVILHMIVESNENEQIPRKRPRIVTESRVPQSQLPKLDPLDFDVLRSICTALKPFEHATKMFCKETTSAGCILPTLNSLKQHLRQQSDREVNLAAALVEHLLIEITIRYEKLRNNDLLWFSTLMDPRFAYCTNIISQFEWREIEDKFVNYCTHTLKLGEIDAPGNVPEDKIVEEQQPTSSTTFNSHGIEIGDIADNYDDSDIDLEEPESDDEEVQLFQRPVRASSPTTSDASANSVQVGAVLKSELANYSAFLAIQNKDPKEIDIFTWWNEQRLRFSMLSRAARALRCIPATSVCSERLFSKATLLFSNNLRNRLHASTVQNLLVAKANLSSNPLLELDENCSKEDDESPDSEEQTIWEHIIDEGMGRLSL